MSLVSFGALTHEELQNPPHPLLNRAFEPYTDEQKIQAAGYLADAISIEAVRLAEDTLFVQDFKDGYEMGLGLVPSYKVLKNMRVIHGYELNMFLIYTKSQNSLSITFEETVNIKNESGTEVRNNLDPISYVVEISKHLFSSELWAYNRETHDKIYDLVQEACKTYFYDQHSQNTGPEEGLIMPENGWWHAHGEDVVFDVTSDERWQSYE